MSGYTALIGFIFFMGFSPVGAYAGAYMYLYYKAIVNGYHDV